MFIVVMHLAIQALSSASLQAYHWNEETNITNRTDVSGNSVKTAELSRPQNISIILVIEDG